MIFKHVPEAFFHFVWKYRLLSMDLTTIHGEKVQIIHPGTHNPDAGPDFLFAKIRIDDTLWVGNVEIHVTASDWFGHKHQYDPAYNNVILHVVAENDMIAIDQSGRKLQSLCIGDRFSEKLLIRFKEINENLLWIPCMKLIGEVDKIQIMSSVHALAIERLAEKADHIRAELDHCKNDWEECCYRMISIQFGARVNTNQFEMLSKTLPVKILMKYHKQLFQLEALLFGQSGLLNTKLFGLYPRKLKKEYAYLSGKHQLSPMPGYLWKFLRLRPAAFPTIRLAQLAKLYDQHQRLFLEITEKKSILSLSRLFEVSGSPYWEDHYLFDRKSKRKKKKFGRQGIELLLINAILPLIYLYGDIMNKPELCDRAIAFLEELPAENNAVIRRWKSMNVHPANALETQGLLQLKKTRCDKKSCLKCSIGHQLLKQQS